MPDEPFLGFYPPEYTQVPNNLFDDLMPRLSGAELKVLLYVMRATFGWHRDAAAISLTALQGGTGLTRKTLSVAVRSLEALGCMLVSRSVGDDGAAAVTVYRLSIVERGGRGITTPRQGNYSSGGRGVTPHLPIEERNPVKETEAVAAWEKTLAALSSEYHVNAGNIGLLRDLPVRIDAGVLVIRCPADVVRKWRTIVQKSAAMPVRFEAG